MQINIYMFIGFCQQQQLQSRHAKWQKKERENER